MTKFSRKEKIALIIFGIILLAIVVQMFFRLAKFQSSQDRPRVDESIAFPHDNILSLNEVTITAASQIGDEAGPDKLIDNDPTTIWHVPLDLVDKPTWVMVDLGEGNDTIVHSLAARPRQDIPRQFFRSAELFGSNDGEDWEPISKIIQGTIPNSATWKEWEFENDQAFRFYKLAISSGHEGGNFFSMAELALSE